MKEQLIHILDQSVCLSRKQMKEYLSGTMLPEEAHAAEVHLSSCPLCSLAMEGFEEHTEEALAAIASLNSGFLKEHFDNISPQIHLNSMAPSAAIPSANPSRKTIAMPGAWRVGSVAAAALLIFGLLWAFERRSNTIAPPSRQPVGVGTGGDNGGKTNGSQQGTRPLGTSGQTKSSANEVTAPGTSSGMPDAKADVNAATPISSAPKQTNDALTPLSPTAKDGMSGVGKMQPGAPTEAEKVYRDFTPAPEPESTKADDSKSEANTPDRSDDATAKKASPKPNVTSQSTNAQADDNKGNLSYAQGIHISALEVAKKGMASTTGDEHYHHMLNAAYSYASLGENAKAIELLKLVIDNGSGPDRRAAKKVLRKLE